MNEAKSNPTPAAPMASANPPAPAAHRDAERGASPALRLCAVVSAVARKRGRP